MAGDSARATVEVGVGGAVTKVTVTSGGKNYSAGDIVYLALDNGGGTVAYFQVPASGITARSR